MVEISRSGAMALRPERVVEVALVPASAVAGVPSQLATGDSLPRVPVASGCRAMGAAGVSTSAVLGGSGRRLLPL